MYYAVADIIHANITIRKTAVTASPAMAIRFLFTIMFSPTLTRLYCLGQCAYNAVTTDQIKHIAKSIIIGLLDASGINDIENHIEHKISNQLDTNFKTVLE